MAFPDDSPRAGFSIDANGIRFENVPWATEAPTHWYTWDENGYLTTVPLSDAEKDEINANLQASRMRQYHLRMGGEEYAARLNPFAKPTTTEPSNVEIIWAEPTLEPVAFYWDGEQLFRCVAGVAS